MKDTQNMDKEPGFRKDWFGRYRDGFRYTRPAFVLMIMYENHEFFYECISVVECVSAEPARSDWIP